MGDQATVSLLRWLRRQLREPTPWRERLEAAVANNDPAEARRLLEQMDFTEAQRRHVAGLLDDVSFDAATRDRAAELAALRDRQARADRPRRGAPVRDHRRDDDALTRCLPALDLGKDLLHPCSLPAR